MDNEHHNKIGESILVVGDRILEIATVSYSFFWGITLLFPGSTFDGSASYNAMNALASENVFGVLFIILALAQVVGFNSGRFGLIRRMGYLIATGVWFTVAAMFFISTPLSTGNTYLIQAALTGYLYWKEGMNKT